MFDEMQFAKLINQIKENSQIASLVVKDFHRVFRYEKEYKFGELLDYIRDRYGYDLNDIFSNAKRLNIGFCVEETAIDELFNRMRNNNSLEELVAKVSIVNQLYSAGLNSSCGGRRMSILEMAEHIYSMRNYIEKYTGESENAAVDLVKDLAKDETIKTIDGKDKYRATSFASKYLSFEMKTRDIDAIPITDSKSRKALAYIFDESESKLEKYDYYYQKINEFKNKLNQVTYKEIDAFLWILGKAISIEEEVNKLNKEAANGTSTSNKVRG